MNETKKSVEKMTLEQFFGSEKRMAIHCETKEQSKILLKAFDEMGKTWSSGESYLKKNNWEPYSTETCYGNEGCYCSKKWLKDNEYEIIDFKNIEFSKKKLTHEEITKWILENCVDNNGMVNLQGLDFGDKNVNISFLKTTGYLYQSNQEVGKNLYQNHQEVGGNIYQDSQKVNCDLYQSKQVVGLDLVQENQKVGGHLYQSSQEVGGNLIQSGQKVSGNLCQDLQKVGGKLFQGFQEVKNDLIQSNQIVSGNLYSHKLEPNEMWEQKSCYVVKKKVLKPITHKELAEMGFEIKD